MSRARPRKGQICIARGTARSRAARFAPFAGDLGLARLAGGALGSRSQSLKTTLAIYDALLQANIPKAAARGVAEALEKDMEAVLATKADLRVLEEKIDRRFELIEQKLHNLELCMTVKLGSLIIVGFTIFGAISKFL
jgi:multidrug efflux pump subunit AcrA (membrane-fusion protein)